MSAGAEDARQSEAAERLDWLDYARFAAASAVVLFHYGAHFPRQSGEPYFVGAEYGYLGVDLFFIISGYVVLYSALGRTADQFAVSRATRLWPTFAFCATISAIVLVAFGADVSLTRYFANLTMVPEYLGVAPLDGSYWSLALELAFYAAVFAILCLGAMKHIRAIVTAWVGALILARIGSRLLGWPEPPLLGNYFDLFASGCVLALLKRNGPSSVLSISLVIAIVLSLEGAFQRGTVLAQTRPIEPWLCAAVVAALFVPFVFFRGGGPALPGAKFLGGITYPLYLLHSALGFIALQALNLPHLVELGLVGAGAIACAALVYVQFELRTSSLRKRAFDRTLGVLIRGLMRQFGAKSRRRKGVLRDPASLGL